MKLMTGSADRQTPDFTILTSRPPSPVIVSSPSDECPATRRQRGDIAVSIRLGCHVTVQPSPLDGPGGRRIFLLQQQHRVKQSPRRSAGSPHGDSRSHDASHAARIHPRNMNMGVAPPRRSRTTHRYDVARLRHLRRPCAATAPSCWSRSRRRSSRRPGAARRAAQSRIAPHVMSRIDNCIISPRSRRARNASTHRAGARPGDQSRGQ